jgi:hypothetical protein
MSNNDKQISLAGHRVAETGARHPDACYTRSRYAGVSKLGKAQGHENRRRIPDTAASTEAHRCLVESKLMSLILPATHYNEGCFGKRFPSSCFMINDRWATATWIMGNNYRGSGYYGAYPPAYVPRIYSMFPESRQILHLFSGSLTDENVFKPSAEVRRLDLNPQYNPDYVRDAVSTGLPDNQFDLIMADPPYSKEDAEHYGKPLCNRNKVLAECHRILSADGCLVWLDQSQPMYSKTHWEWVGVVSVLRSTNHRVRAAFFFRPCK